jgi:hypothetical protein
MEGLIVSHLADSGRRREIAGMQRADVEGRLSYAAGIQRVIEEIGKLIEEENDVMARAA